MAQTPIDPRFLEFRDWSTAMRVQNPNLPRAVSEPQWLEWAVQVSEFDRNAPDPRRFADWRSWAATWMQTL